MGTHYFLVVLSLCVAGMVQGMCGFGFGLIAMPLTSLFLDIKSSSTLILIFVLVTSGYAFFSHHHHFSWKNSFSLLFGVCLGIPFGVSALLVLDEHFLRRCLGLLLCGLSLNEWLNSGAKRSLNHRFGFPIGFLSGVMGGAFNMGGPPQVAYVYSQKWTKEEMMAQLQVIFFISAVFRIILTGVSGMECPSLWNMIGISLLPVIMMTCLGNYFFKNISQKKLKHTIFLFLGMMGCFYLLNS